MIGCPAYKHQHELTTPKFLNTSIALGSKADIFAKDNEIAALNIFTSDFSLHTDLFIPWVIYSPRISNILVWMFSDTHM